MTIPKIQNVPTKQITLPLSKKKVKIRPFLVREEKILIMAREEEENKTEAYINAMQQIIDACSFGKLNATELSQPDLESIFLEIRMMSKGETSKFQYRCLEEVPDESTESDLKKCNTLIPVSINLKDIKLNLEKDHTDLFQIPNNDIYIKMKYPSIDVAARLEEEGVDVANLKTLKWAQVESLIVSCIESIIEGTEKEADTYSDFSREELIEWLETVPTETLEDIVKRFFANAPYLSYDLEMKCPGCGADHKIELRGIENFFE